MKVTIDGFINWCPSAYAGDPEFHFHPCDMNGYSGYVMVMPYSFEVEIPDDFDPRPAQIAKLKEDRRELQAKFALDLMNIEASISKLLALEAV